MLLTTATATSRCFVYGTLMAPEVLRTLLGRVPDMDPRPAFLQPSYRRHPVKGRVFPGVIAATRGQPNNHEQGRVNGILLSGITPEEMDILDWFEDDGYGRRTVFVRLGDNDHSIIDADMYLWIAGDDLLDLESSWSFEDFKTHKLNRYLRTTVRPCREEYDNFVLTYERR